MEPPTRYPVSKETRERVARAKQEHETALERLRAVQAIHQAAYDRWWDAVNDAWREEIGAV